ncbi:secreted and transmembrane protein 1 isoform X3 [Grammomys surdaster]|uniref:secreted and transmembrane protein 1 isoform X3 n=1 Tax=Grammomys surdaster TaxID=491861 RepID=UPI00109F357E|nr:secreted and transmembrane protein 1 isoform X3 [Grammomys surdaster]
MLTFPLVSTIPTLQLFIILLLVVSLNAHNKSWDRPICTEGIVSVPRGDPAVMTCNISNAFTDITIQLTAHGKEDRTIFNKKPQGNFSWSGWELHVQGGQAQLVIKDTQDDHTGIYLWQLHGCQRYYRNITLNISGSRTPAAGTEAGVNSYNTQPDGMSLTEPSNEDKVTDTRLFTPDPGKKVLSLWPVEAEGSCLQS